MKPLSVEDGTEMDEREAMALETLHNASRYLAAHFSSHMTRDKAKSNLEARAYLFNCSNLIFKQHGCGITREEVEGAREANTKGVEDRTDGRLSCYCDLIYCPICYPPAIVVRPATPEELTAQAESYGKNYKPGPRQAVPFMPSAAVPVEERKTVEMFCEEELWERHSQTMGVIECDMREERSLMKRKDFSAALDEFINSFRPVPERTAQCKSVREDDGWCCQKRDGHEGPHQGGYAMDIFWPIPGERTAESPEEAFKRGQLVVLDYVATNFDSQIDWASPLGSLRNCPPFPYTAPEVDHIEGKAVSQEVKE